MAGWVEMQYLDILLVQHSTIIVQLNACFICHRKNIFVVDNDTSLIILQLLLQAGDVETNPGPLSGIFRINRTNPGQIY